MGRLSGRLSYLHFCSHVNDDRDIQYYYVYVNTHYEIIKDDLLHNALQYNSLDLA